MEVVLYFVMSLFVCLSLDLRLSFDVPLITMTMMEKFKSLISI